jgi:hypothetical protein
MTNTDGAANTGFSQSASEEVERILFVPPLDSRPCPTCGMEASEQGLHHGAISGGEESGDDLNYPCFSFKYKKNHLDIKKVKTLPLKKFYTDMASILIPLAIFAGGITLATQFIIQCPNTRLQALLALASQLFLATPLSLLPVYLVLYGLKDEDSISYESQRHAFVCTQFVISGIMLSAAFVLLGTAIYVADETEKAIGSWGLGLLTLLLLLAIATGMVATGFWKWLPSWLEIRQRKRDEKKKKSGRIVWPSVWRFVPLALLQLAVVCLLLGFGGRAASRAPHQYGCNTTSAVGGAASDSQHLEYF